MARANQTDTELELEQQQHEGAKQSRPHMRRSQSQRSLNRLSTFEKKGLTALKALEPDTISPPTTPPPPPQQQQEQPQQPSAQEPSVSSPAVLKKQPAPTLVLKSSAPPVEQTFHATANNLLVAQSSYSSSGASALQQQKPSSSAINKKAPLRSQFLDRSSISNVASAANAQPPGISRTQQKLLLQRQHCLVDDENNLAHPRNMIRLTRELERVGREYRCVKQFRDPMLESLMRCYYNEVQEQEQEQHRSHQRAQSASSIFPVTTTATTAAATSSPLCEDPHAHQRQAIHRRRLELKMMQQLDTTAAYNNNNDSNNNNYNSSALGGMIRWSAGALLGRVWNASQ